MREMFAIVHQMRTRIVTSVPLNGERIIGAILFENTNGQGKSKAAHRGLLSLERETGRRF